MKKISLITASLLLASNLVASDNSFDSAIKAGSVSGDITLYGETQSNSGSNKDSGFTMGSINLGYETGDFNGFKAAVGARANHDFSEKEEGDYDGGSDDTKAIMHTANISYTNEYFGLTVGRQEIDLEWMGDFHEAVVLGITAIQDTTVVLGYSNRQAVADSDAVLEKFSKFNNDDGAYVLDVKYEGIKGLVLNPYYYNADNIASWYGLKADYDNDMFGITAHGAKSSEDSSSNDGQILHLEGRANISGLALSTGYITTDKDVGIASIGSLGDNINPWDRITGGDGNHVYDADADTAFIHVGYDLDGLELGALYGQTDYSSNKEKELNLTASYGITEQFSVGALFIDVDAQDSDDDYNKFALTLEYAF